MQTMKDVINYPDRRMQQYRGRHGGFVYRFSRFMGNRNIVVVAEIKNQECWLMSVWST